jgi:alpha-beta hydrolase superfamily lysophospholipase
MQKEKQSDHCPKSVNLIVAYLLGFVIFLLLQSYLPRTSLTLILILILQGIMILGGASISLIILRDQLPSLWKISLIFSLLGIAIFFSLSLSNNINIRNRLCEYNPRLFKPFNVKTIDNLEIVGLSSSKNHNKAIIMAHGVADQMTGCTFLSLASSLTDQYDMYLFNFRGYGNSEGRSSFGLFEERDLEAVIEYVQGKEYNAIGIIGNSMGGMVTLKTVKTKPGIDAVIIVSSPAGLQLSLDDEATNLFNLLQQRVGRTIYQIFTQVPVDNALDLELSNVPSPVEDIKALSPTPVLIIHGTEDEIVNIEHAQILYQAAGEPKSKYIFYRGGHSITSLYDQFGMDFENLIREWLIQYL